MNRKGLMGRLCLGLYVKVVDIVVVYDVGHILARRLLIIVVLGTIVLLVYLLLLLKVQILR